MVVQGSALRIPLKDEPFILSWNFVEPSATEVGGVERPSSILLKNTFLSAIVSVVRRWRWHVVCGPGVR